jgi:hypothetical protein
VRAARLSKHFGARSRAGVPVAGTLAALLVGAVLGCHRSEPVGPSSDRNPVPATAKKHAPASSLSDRDAIEAVAKGFVKAQKEQDQEAAKALLTDKAEAHYDELLPGNLRDAFSGGFYQLGEPVISGDTAQVPVTIREAGKEVKVRLKLRRVGGKWQVFAMLVRRIPNDPDSEIVMNFEDPEAIYERVLGFKPADTLKDLTKNRSRPPDGGEQAKPRPEDLAVEALRSLSRDLFDASWKAAGADLSSKGRPAGEVLSELATGVGRSLETTPIQDLALARPVAIEVRGLPRFQAIEEVTRSMGLSPVYSTSKVVRLKTGRDGRSVAFAGPFLVEVDDINEAVPDATGMLNLTIRAWGLPQAILEDLNPGRNTLTVTDVVDARGRSLVDIDAAMSLGNTSWRQIPGELDRTIRLPLKGLLRDVSSIRTLRCKVRVPLPATVKRIKFDTLAAGQTRKVGDIEVTLETATKRNTSFYGMGNEGQDLRIVVHHKSPVRATRSEPHGSGGAVSPGDVSERVKLVGYDAQGRPLYTASSGFFHGDSVNWTAELGGTIRGPAVSLVVNVVTNLATVEYEPLLEEIPLPSHD